MKHETPFVLKVRQLIRRNLHLKDYHSDNLCQSLAISRSQLYRRLKQQSGKSFSEIQNEIRIDEACSLLEKMDMNVSEIANSLGYNDPSYFVRVFRNQIGMTPGKYKKSIPYSLRNKN